MIIEQGGVILWHKTFYEVNNCKFWANGNKCSAEAIYVVSHKGKHASTTEETDCKTFDPEV